MLVLFLEHLYTGELKTTFRLHRCPLKRLCSVMVLREGELQTGNRNCGLFFFFLHLRLESHDPRFCKSWRKFNSGNEESYDTTACNLLVLKPLIHERGGGENPVKQTQRNSPDNSSSCFFCLVAWYHSLGNPSHFGYVCWPSRLWVILGQVWNLILSWHPNFCDKKMDSDKILDICQINQLNGRYMVIFLNGLSVTHFSTQPQVMSRNIIG